MKEQERFDMNQYMLTFVHFIFCLYEHSAAQVHAMAIAATQNAATSCAAGVSASETVAVVPMGSFGMDSTTTTTTVAISVSVVAAAAVAAGMLASSNAALIIPPSIPNTICTNIDNPDVQTGRLGLTFLNKQRRLLTQQEAQLLEDELEESYNRVFGCIEDCNSRTIINCALPCRENGCCEI